MIEPDGVIEAPEKIGLVVHLQKIIFSQKVHLQNLSVLVFVNFLVAGLGFLTRVKIANTLGKEGFGLLAYGLVLGRYAGTLVRFGLDRTLVRDLVHYPKRFGELVTASLILRGSMFILVLIGLLIWKFLEGPETELTWALFIVIIAHFVVSLDLQATYDSWHKMSRHAVYRLIQRLCYLGCVWGLVLFVPGKLNILWIGALMLGSVVLYLSLQYNWAFKRIDFKNISVSLIKTACRMGRGNLWIWLAAMGCLSFGSLNQLILKHYSGTAELGGYAAAWQIVAIAMLLLTQISRVGNPATARITRKDSNQSARIRFLTKYSVVMFVVAAPVGIAALICPELIITLLFRPEYASAASVMRIMGIYIMVFSLGLIASQYVVSAHLEKIYFTTVIVGGILSITLCLVLIPRMAGYGSALALLIAHGASMGLYWVVMIQHVRKQR
ncbi:MAG: flippase [Desulfobacterales bacterium]|nr:flippase [Desulfobacterales bacterium]